MSALERLWPHARDYFGMILKRSSHVW